MEYKTVCFQYELAKRLTRDHRKFFKILFFLKLRTKSSTNRCSFTEAWTKDTMLPKGIKWIIKNILWSLLFPENKTRDRGKSVHK